MSPRLTAAILLLWACAHGADSAPPSPSPAPAPTATLICVRQGSGFGTIDPPAAWPPGKRHTVARGGSQTLTATPAAGSQFAGWTGDLPDGQDPRAATIIVTMDRDRELRAEFTRTLRTLDFRVDPPLKNWTVLPEPGWKVFPEGDTVLLYARPDTAEAAPQWVGKAQPLTEHLARVLLTEDMTVSLAAGGTKTAGENPVLPLDPERDATVNVPLRARALSGWFSAPYTQGTPWGAGLSWIAHDSHPNTCPFRWVALNFEHIFSGAAADNLRAGETPRRDPMVLAAAPPDTVRMHWPAEKSSWNMDCDMTYTLAAPNAVDIRFTATPRTDYAPMGYLALMWASYLNYARDGLIRFWGEENGREGWCTLGEPENDARFEKGATVPYRGQADLPVQPATLVINITEHPAKRFVKPLYYGLTDGDGDYATQDDTMAVIMMFDREEPIRLARWNWTGNPHWPAWDWQFVIHDPKAGTPYTYRARMVFKPFVSPDDVMAEYERWRAALPPEG